MIRLALAALLLSGPAVAAGFDSRTGVRGAAVDVPCYPEDVFRICRIPDVEGHYPGYMPPELRPDVNLYAGDDRFVILVTPNIVPYEDAVRDAARAASHHCGPAATGEVRARIDTRARYAPDRIESWYFAGACR